MAKQKNPIKPINLDTFGSEFDDVFNQLNPTTKKPEAAAEDLPAKEAAGSDKRAKTDAVPPSSATKAKRAATKPAETKKQRSPGKEKAATPLTTDASEDEPALSLPETRFSREDLAYFFGNEADTSEVKQLYVARSTKEILHQVARMAGIPVGHLADNILRWFLWAHKNDIKKVISRDRDTLDRLDM